MKLSNSSCSKSFSASNSSDLSLSRPTSAISVAVESEIIIDSEFLGKSINSIMQSRPIVNSGNRCYMISVLQVLLHTKPFTNYMQRYFLKLELLPSALSTGRFPLLNAFNNFYGSFWPSKETTRPVSQDPIDEIFLALTKKNGSFSGAGFAEQEDAEEFLTALLDALGDEFIALQSSKLLTFSLPYDGTINFNHNNNKKINDALDDDADDWLQVGPKQRTATTRRTPVNQSPIHSLFAGSFQSLYRAPGVKPSITFEPFTVLPLALVTERDIPIDSITRAIEHVIRCEELGRKCTKQLLFSSLPPILIIQLKRFIFHKNCNSIDLHKITRPLKIPIHLQLTQNNSKCNFNLYGLVNHHGSSLHGGHYTATIKKKSSEEGNGDDGEEEKDDSDWLIFDDDLKIQSTHHHGFANNSSGYLLFYERQNDFNKSKR